MTRHWGSGGAVVAAAVAATLTLGGGALAQSKKLEIVTLPAGSVAHGAASGIGSVVSQKSDLTLLAAPYAGPQVLVPMVNRGAAAFTLLNVADTHEAYRGIKPAYKAAHGNLRLVSVGYENRVSALTTAKSGIGTIKDIKGRRVAGVYSAHKTCAAMAAAVMANFGLDWKDVKVVPVPSVVPGVKALGEGRAEVNPCAAIGMGAVREVNAKTPLKFLSVNPAADAMKRATEHFVGLRAEKAKGGSSDGLTEDVYVFHYDFYLLTHAKVPDDVVYTVVKTLWNNLDDLRKTHGALRSWKRERMASTGVTAPYHPGAVKFFKEAGAWNAELEAERGKLLKN